MAENNYQFLSTLSKIYVAVPYCRLVDEFFDSALSMSANLELGMHAKALERFSLSDFKEMAKRMEDKGIRTTFHAAFQDLCPGSIDPRIRKVSHDRIHQVLDLCPVFSPESVVCHHGYHPLIQEEIYDEYLKNSIEFWSSLSPKLKDLNTVVMVENVLEYGPEFLKSLMQGVDSPSVRVCFDTGHIMAFSRTLQWEVWLDALGPYLGQIHVHDNNGSGDQHLALGKGNFPFDEFFSGLAEKGLDPIVTLEAHSVQDVVDSLPVLNRLLNRENIAK